MPPDSDRPARSRSQLVVLGPAGFLLLLGALSAFPPVTTDIYLPALPQLTAELHGTTAEGQTTLAAFFLGLSLGQLVYGPWSDRIGRRPILLIGVAVYLLACIGCAVVHSMWAMIALRFIQAVGASAAVVVASAIVRDRYDHRESARVLSVIMLVRGLGPILAPIVGGLIVTLGGWRSIFWVLGGFGALMTASVLFALEETRTAEVAARARSEHPLRAYLQVLKSPKTMAYVGAGCLNFGCLFAWVAGAPFLLIGAYKIAPLYFGWVFAINAAGFMIAAEINRGLLKRGGRPDAIMALAATGAAAAAVLLLVNAVTGFGGPYGVLMPLFFVIGSLGFVSTNAQAGALAVDPSRSGTVSAIFGAGQFILGFFATLAGAILSRQPAIGMGMVMVACGAGAAIFSAVLARGSGVADHSSP